MPTPPSGVNRFQNGDAEILHLFPLCNFLDSILTYMLTAGTNVRIAFKAG